MYKTVRQLVHLHRDMRAVVMGGGPSLPEQLGRCPGRSSAIYISANHHGAMLVGCNYIVALDKIEEKVRPFGVPVITRHFWGDYRILNQVAPNSGVAAAWIAFVMGCSPIFIAGMDLGGSYFHDPAAKSGLGFTRDDHLRHWVNMMREHPAEWRPVGGPLADLAFPAAAPASRQSIEKEIAGEVIEFVGPTPYRGRDFVEGERAELRQHEARRFISKGLARSV